MEVANLPMASNMSANSVHSTDAFDFVCEQCFKSYQRRDLLMRHRRRCKGPKATTRRKACDGCFQAKVKCCYTQPTCTRCTKRGTPCIYSTSTAEPRNETVEASPSSRDSASSLMDATTSLDLPPWNLSPPSYSLDSFEMAMETSNQELDTSTYFDATQSLMLDENMMFTSMPLGGMPLSPPTSTARNGNAIPAASPPPSPDSHSLIRVLSDYPSLLMKGSFSTPILHSSMYALYSNIVPDMTYLPQTSMAICCASGVSTEKNRFFRRAMDAAKQRLIGTFPSSACMQQWDSLHAMLIYESLGLRESVRDASESRVWNHDPRVQGIGSPFLLKMVKVYSQPYSQIRNPDITIFNDPSSSPCSAATSQWARWRITETARRTIFFANMLNFYCNRDPSTGKQVPYYEPFNEDLILHMPLPCSQAAWEARDEKEWILAMNHQEDSANNSSLFNTGGFKSLSSEILKNVLSNFTKEYLQLEIGSNVGFGNSDELRRLIILSASEQFA